MNSQRRNSIWAKWILFFSFIIIFAGCCFLFVFPFLFPQVTEPLFTEITGMTLSDLTKGQIRHNNLLMGVCGALMMGWGIMLTFLGYRLVYQPEDWIWTSITFSLIVWYVSDTSISVMARSSLNVIINCIFLLAVLPPLISSRKKIINGLKNVKT